MMKKMETVIRENRGKKENPPAPPPPPPPLSQLGLKPARKSRVTRSITNQEIERFWKRKRAEQEEHFLAAMKAAARIRARNLTEDDYKRFEESLNDQDDKESNGIKNETDKELRVGVKDWWRKSKYAYLNQPAIGSQDTSRKRNSTYASNTCFYKPTPLYPTSLGVF